MPIFRRVFYGWVMVGLTGVIMIVGTSPLFAAMPNWFLVFDRQFGWGRTELAIAFVLYRVEGSILGPLGGYLIEKLGSRRNVLIGMLITGAGFLLLGWIQELWQFYAAFVVITVGIGLGTWFPMITSLNHWFDRHRAKAMAWAIVGFMVGGVVVVPLIAWAINPDVPDRFGWRNTAMAIGAFTMVFAWPASALVRNTPEAYGEHPDGDAPVPDTPVHGSSRPAVNHTGAESGYTWQEAVRTKAFWLITLGHSTSSVVFTVLTVHLGVMLYGRGISFGEVALVVAIYTGVGGVFTLVGGYVADRVPIRFAACFFNLFQTWAVVVLLAWDSLPAAFLFAVLFGIGFGGRSPATTAIRGAYFGRRSFASIMGVSMIPMNLLMLGGPLYAGFEYDRTGSYFVPFAVIAALNLAGSAMFLFLGRPKPIEETAPGASRRVRSAAP